MDGKLQDFSAATTGKVVGDTPENKGQCVGLVEVWIDAFGLPHIWGNAKDLLTNADKNAYDVIYNTPTNVPAPGSIVCWDATWGGGFGHTALVLKADVNTITVLEQNNPIGSPVKQATHTYPGVQGWIYPKVFAQTFNQVVADTTMQDAVTACQTQLKSATENNKNLQEQIVRDENTINGLRINIETLQKDVNTLKLDKNESDNSVIALKLEIAEIHKQDADYGKQAIQAREIKDKLENGVKEVMDALEKTYNQETVEQDMHDIAVKVLSQKDNGVDPFLKELVDWLKSKNVDGALETLGHSPLNPNNLQDPGERAKIFTALEGVWSFAMSKDTGTTPNETAVKAVEGIATYTVKHTSFLSLIWHGFWEAFKKPQPASA
jgi:surface antigen